MRRRRYDAVVVGAGHNGLVCSFYLARAGLRVGVFERRDLVGGAAVTEPLLDGARFSTCANMLWGLQQRVVDDMGLVGHGFRYRHVDPVALHLYRDGSFLRTWRDPRRTAEEIARLNPGDGRAFAAWDAYWARAARLMSSFVLAGPPSREDVLERARADGFETFAVDILGSSLADVVQRHFEDRRVQAAFVAANDFGDPSAPGSAWTQAFGHIGRTGEVGDAFVDGGLGALTAAMARAAAAEGVDIHTGAEVDLIRIAGARAVGVRLAGDVLVDAPIVVSGADPKRTMLRLVEPARLDPSFREHVSGLATSAGCVKLHAVARELPDVTRFLGRPAEPREVAVVRIVESLDHLREASRAAFGGDLPVEPVIGGLMIPSVYDPSLISGPRHTVSIWVPYFPVRPQAGSWPEIGQNVGRRIIDFVSEYVPNFTSSLVEWTLLTPADIESRMALTDGSIHHTDITPEQFDRGRTFDGHGYGTPIEGLFLCGGGVYPGGEVTGAPGHNAAHAILERCVGQTPALRPS